MRSRKTTMKVEFAPETMEKLGSVASGIVSSIVDAKSKATTESIDSINKSVDRFCTTCDKWFDLFARIQMQSEELKLEERKRRLSLEEAERKVELEKAQLDIAERKQRLAIKDEEFKLRKKENEIQMCKWQKELDDAAAAASEK